jgi:hypothetical protein
MTSSIFTHKGSEIQHNRSFYGFRAVETLERAAPISPPDSQISPVALGAIYDGADDAIDDDEPSDFSTAVAIAAAERKFSERDHPAIRRNLREWAQSAAIHLQALVVLYDPPDARELCDAIAAIENAMRAPANSAARRAAADRLAEISARLNEIGAPLRAADEHRRAEYRRSRQAKRLDHEADNALKQPTSTRSGETPAPRPCPLPSYGCRGKLAHGLRRGFSGRPRAGSNIERELTCS